MFASVMTAGAIRVTVSFSPACGNVLGDLDLRARCRFRSQAFRNLPISLVSALYPAAPERIPERIPARMRRRDLGKSYVVIIPRDYKVTLARGADPVRADEAAARAVFERRSAGNGTKGPATAAGRCWKPATRKSSCWSAAWTATATSTRSTCATPPRAARPHSRISSR